MTPLIEPIRINYGHGGRIGVLLPSGNTAIEPQFEALRPPGISCHFARLPLAGSSERQLLAMTERVEEAALLLKDAGVDVIAFHCTAVSTWDPALELRTLERIETATGLPAIATSQALVAALGAVRAGRITMLSPYSKQIALREQAFLEQRGLRVMANRYLGLDTPGEMIAVPPREWLDRVVSTTGDAAEAVLVSCTAIRAVEIVEAAEKAIGMPVVTSNSAMLWYAARKVGHLSPIAHIGVLGSASVTPH